MGSIKMQKDIDDFKARIEQLEKSVDVINQKLIFSINAINKNVEILDNRLKTIEKRRKRRKENHGTEAQQERSASDC